MKLIAIFIGVLFSLGVNANSVGFGKVVGIKIYDFKNENPIRIYLNVDSTASSWNNSNCLIDGRIVANISLPNHDEVAISRILSVALAAQMAGKKVRIHSESTSETDCEVDFIAIQETAF